MYFVIFLDHLRSTIAFNVLEFIDSNENVQSGILSKEHQNQHVATNLPPGNDGNPLQASQLELAGHSVVCILIATHNIKYFDQLMIYGDIVSCVRLKKPSLFY